MLEALTTETSRFALSIAVVFALLGLMVWLGRRGGPYRIIPRLIHRTDSQALSALERVTLTPQHSLHVVRFGNRKLMIATHPHGCTVLSEVPIQETKAGSE